MKIYNFIIQFFYETLQTIQELSILLSKKLRSSSPVYIKSPLIHRYLLTIFSIPIFYIESSHLKENIHDKNIFY